MMLPSLTPQFGEFRHNIETFHPADTSKATNGLVTTLTLLSTDEYKRPDNEVDALVFKIQPKSATLELIKEGNFQRGYLFFTDPSRTYDWFKSILAPCVSKFSAPDEEKTRLLTAVTEHLNRLKG